MDFRFGPLLNSDQIDFGAASRQSAVDALAKSRGLLRACFVFLARVVKPEALQASRRFLNG
ncbi:hypothetical protein KTQ42_02795|uniref:hypothetical protein n=1 Tax=Noviherbaspirillum sp. L7-7A TaxID=2850560 RepID=UPI001C2C33B5|nr:hypothetical protein [Noviherbaspirillum sp. L7-7A]MBV0878233.1 hypothetical protein [Noviherbaspirillum sp. L7-7A]